MAVPHPENMKISHRALQPTEIEDRSITVILFQQSSKNKISVETIKEAIEEIKNKDSPHIQASKIDLSGEVVFHSERNGTIEYWEQEWKRQKRVLSLNESVRKCPFNVSGCFENDLCIECQIEKAAARSEKDS